MCSIKREELADLFRSIGMIMLEKKDVLCEMDSKVGDGDLGLTMSKGFGELPDIINNIEEEDIGKAIIKGGMKLSSIIPSTMGFLMSSGLMNGGKKIIGKSEIGAQEYSDFLIGFMEGIIKRGNCAEGDRTILDAIAPAARVAERSVSQEKPLTIVSNEAWLAAQKGAESTKYMLPKFGKAAVHKEACKGVVDQGACAGVYFIQGINNYIQCKAKH